MLNKVDTKNKNNKIVDESLILSLSQSFPPRYPPITHPDPYIIKQIPAFKLFYFLSSTLGSKCNIVLVATPKLSPSRMINPKLYFILG